MGVELDKHGLFLEVLGDIDPDLSETLRIERELHGKPIDVVSINIPEGSTPEEDARNSELADMAAGDPAVGRVVLREERQRDALLLAEAISSSLGRLWAQAHQGGKLNWNVLFLGTLSQIDPGLFETLKLEAAVTGHPVEMLLPEEVDPSKPHALGTVTLQDSEQAERAHYAAEAANELREIFERNTIEIPTWKLWFRRR